MNLRRSCGFLYPWFRQFVEIPHGWFSLLFRTECTAWPSLKVKYQSTHVDCKMYLGFQHSCNEKSDSLQPLVTYFITFSLTFRAFSRRFYPKRLTFVHLWFTINISQLRLYLFLTWLTSCHLIERTFLICFPTLLDIYFREIYTKEPDKLRCYNPIVILNKELLKKTLTPVYVSGYSNYYRIQKS